MSEAGFPPGTPVPSPCIGVCRLDEAATRCLGCLRTLDEIAAWSRAGEAQKRAIWRAIAERRAALA
jgi:predicted Fe-S protein YdhL (DUF1289 family)